jgi:hypothetical protein
LTGTWPALGPLAIADRQEAFAFGEGDVLPPQVAEFPHPQARIEQELDDRLIARSPEFDGAQESILLAVIRPARVGRLVRNGPGTAPSPSSPSDVVSSLSFDR